MAFGLTQAGADAIAAYLADTLMTGSTNVLEIIDSSDTVLATASDVTLTDTNNVIAVSSAAGASVGTTGTAAGFRLKDSGGTNTYFEAKNTSFTITPANQSAANDTFTSTGHGMSAGQAAVITDGIPASSVSSGDTIFVTEETANTFKIERSPGSGAVDITAVAASDTTFTVTEAVGDSSSNAMMKLTSGTSLTSGETVPFTTFNITIPTSAVRTST